MDLIDRIKSHYVCIKEFTKFMFNKNKKVYSVLSVKNFLVKQKEICLKKW